MKSIEASIFDDDGVLVAGCYGERNGGGFEYAKENARFLAACANVFIALNMKTEQVEKLALTLKQAKELKLL